VLVLFYLFLLIIALGNVELIEHNVALEAGVRTEILRAGVELVFSLKFKNLT